MNIQPDFEELLRLLEENHVEYLIVGGYAVAFHGHPRFTKDIDIFYSQSIENISKLRTALQQFGFSTDDLPEQLFTTEGTIITFGVEPVSVDIINQIDGMTFDSAWPHRVPGHYGTVLTSFIEKKELIENKKSTQRAQDRADVENLL